MRMQLIVSLACVALASYAKAFESFAKHGHGRIHDTAGLPIAELLPSLQDQQEKRLLFDPMSKPIDSKNENLSVESRY